MKSNGTQFGVIAVFLGMLVVMGLVGFVKPGGVLAKQKWEYKIESVNDDAFALHMRRLGEDGWDLAFARRASDGRDNMMYECIFKRAK